MTMPYIISPEQHLAVASSLGPVRYKHFVSRVADDALVWGLRNESGWVTARDESDISGFAVWPHPDYAADCAFGEWHDCLPSKIEVHDFVTNWLPDMEAKGVAIAVFPTKSMRGIWISPLELKTHIQQELERLE